MPNWASLVVLSLVLSACRAPSAKPTEEPVSAPKALAAGAQPAIAGVDLSALTEREQEKWSRAVEELLAPCSDVPVSLAECVREKRACDACAPAAEFLVGRVRRGDSRKQFEAAFNARFSPDSVKSVPAGDSPRLGAEEPVVQIVEWADFECPFCGFAAPALKSAVEKRPGAVQLVFKHYPLSAHPNADKAARAAVAASRQGKFWPVQQALFASQQEGLEEGQLRAIARKLGLDLKRFEADMTSEATADAVAADRKQAEALDLRGTPMIYINGRHFSLDAFDLKEDLDAWIELEIALRTGRAATQAGASAGAAAQGG